MGKWLIHWRVGLLFRETSKRCKNALTGMSQNSVKKNANFFTWGGRIPCNCTGWGPASEENSFSEKHGCLACASNGLACEIHQK